MMNTNLTTKTTPLPYLDDTTSNTRSSASAGSEVIESNIVESNAMSQNGDAPQSGLWCPNCAKELEARKCKLFCHTSGCGYLVTCSEW